MFTGSVVTEWGLCFSLTWTGLGVTDHKEQTIINAYQFSGY